MIIRLKDNSPMPSCAIWLGDSLIKPAEDTGGKITSITFGSGGNYTGLTRSQNAIVLHDSGYERYYGYVCFTLNVEDMKEQDITLVFGDDLATSMYNDSVLMVGKWDTDYTDDHRDEWDDSYWANRYQFWQADNTEGQERPTKGIVPAPEDNNEHYVQIWLYCGYFGFSAGSIYLCPASLVEGVQSRFTADGYCQTYENEKYVRTVKLVEEVKQQDGTWKKDGYELEGDIDLEYDGKVWAYWTDPKSAKTKVNWDNLQAPIKASDYTVISTMRFNSGVTSIDYIDENIPINKSADYMFQNCSKLTSVPYFDLSKVESAQYMFDGCSSLQTVPSFSFRSNSIVEAYNMFRNCSSLKEISFKDTTSAVKCIAMFYGCKNLAKISNLSYSICNVVSNMFYQCENLYDLGGTINLSSIYKMPLGAFIGMFDDTPYLSDIRFSGTLRDSLSLNNHLTQRSIKDLIKACSTPLDTDAKTLQFKSNTVFINDEPDTYTPLINQAIESGWTFTNLNIVEPADAVGFRYTATDGRKLNPDNFYNTTSGYTNTVQTDGENGLVLWNGDHSDGLRIYIDDSNIASNLKSINGFISKTKISGAFHIRYNAYGEDARWDFTNADFSGASLEDFAIEMRSALQDGIYNLDLSGFDTSKYGNCVSGTEIKNLRLTGSLDYSFSFNVGGSLNRESIKTILQACANSQNTDAKTLHTDVTLKYIDLEGDLTELLNQAIAKGWTIEGIQIISKDEAIWLSYTTTDGEIPQKFIDQGNGRTGTVITSEYGKYYLTQSDSTGNYDINWDNIDTLKTFDGANREFKCRGVNVPYCGNLTKFDSKNIKYYNDHSGYNPERWRRCEKLQDCINLDFSEYTGQDIGSMFAESWNSISNVTFIGSINNTIDFRDAGPKFTYESVKSILTACAATTNTDAKRCIFNNASVSSIKELTALMKTCTDKGWSFEGLTLNNFKLNFRIVSGDTWDNSSVTAYDAEGNVIEPVTKTSTAWEYDDVPAKFMSSTATTAQNISAYRDTDSDVKWTNTAYLFGNSEELTDVNLTKMNTDECENMAGMFYNCPKLNQLNMTTLNFVNVTDTSNMFNGCTNLTKIMFYQANFSSVSNHTDMFKGCDSLAKIILKNSNEATYNMLSAALTEAGKDPAIIVTAATYTNYIYSDPLEDESKVMLNTGIKIGADIKFRVTGRNADKHCGSVWAGYNGYEDTEERLFSHATNVWMFDCGASRIEMNIADARPDYGDGSLLDFTCGNNYMIDNISGKKYTNDSGEQTNFENQNFGLNLKTFYTNSLQIWKNDVLVFDAHVTDDDRFIDNITGTDVPDSQNYQFKKFLDEE